MRFMGFVFVSCFSVCLITALVPPAGATQGSDPGMSTWIASNEPESDCNATAFCWDGTTRTCSGTWSCTAVDSNCPWTKGRVTCDGVTKSCPSCPAEECPADGAPCSSVEDCFYGGHPACYDCICPPLPLQGEASSAFGSYCVCP